METNVSSSKREVVIDYNKPTIVIGERINPTGKRKLAEALKRGDLERVRREAEEQVQAGADIIDVNVSAFGVDDEALLPQAVRAVMETVEVPLCLDSPNPKALEAALKIYQGKPLVNSVTGEEHSLQNVLPLVREYKAAVIGLVQDDEGIPRDVEKRVAIAARIVERSEAAGIPREDIVIDALTLAVGADQNTGVVLLEAVRQIRDRLGVNMVLGISNFSFGLPDRDLVNNTFLGLAIEAGVSCLIADAAKVRSAVLAADLILGRDKYARRYMEHYRNRLRR